MIIVYEYIIMREHLSEPYFSYVYHGDKIWECRPNKPKWQKLKIDDVITWYNDTMYFDTKIVEKREYRTFFEAISDVGLQYVLPNEKNIEEAIESVYRKWYTKEIEEEYGIILIKLEVV